MKAIQLRAIHMANLIGKTVQTEAIGGYPGGPAVVTELFPYPDAPEIVFTVRHPIFGTIGAGQKACLLKVIASTRIKERRPARHKLLSGLSH